MQNCGTGISLIDTHYIYPEFAAVYVMVENEKAAIIETGTNNSVPEVVNSLKKMNIRPHQVAYIFVTHVHLDHSGGASLLAEICPNAKIICHPRAARHLVDPEKLIKGAKPVYGADTFDELFGTINPIAEDRIYAPEDGEELTFGARKLAVLHTPGHAKHHIAIHDPLSNGVFTGDIFGLSYPLLREGTTPFVFPSTSPIDFDPEDALQSLEVIKSTGADRAFLTHFGEITITENYNTLITGINEMKNIMDRAVSSDLTGKALAAFCSGEVEKYLKREIEARGLEYSDAVKKYLELDIDFNGQGIAYVAEKKK